MKRIKIFNIMSAALLFAAASCTSENLLTTDGDFISMNLSSRTMETKATMAGEDPYNENIINDVYYFFYKDGETNAAPAVKGRLVGLDLKSGSKTEEVPVASDAATNLFPSSKECSAFIIANPPKTLESFLSGNPTLTQLRSKLFQSSLDGIQDSFTMIYDDKARQSRTSGNIMTVEAKLRRLANKVTVSLNVIDKVTEGSAQWQSVPADAKVEFHNGFSETALSGDFASVKDGDSSFTGKYFDTEAIDFGEPVKDGDILGCRIERPVYSYPISWDFTGSIEPYLLIELPWKNSTTSETQLTYYKVFFSNKELSHNNWYHFIVDLDRLGGFLKDAPVQEFADRNYMVLDWNDAFESSEGITTEIDDARYLMLNKKEFTLYNQDAWDIPFTTSHECEIADIQFEVMDYMKINPVKIDEDNTEWIGYHDYSCSITCDGALIKFNHELNNNLDSTYTDSKNVINGKYDVAPYKFTFKIRHIDAKEKYVETVTVIQYPAIYIEPEMNTVGNVRTNDETLETTSFVNIPETLAYNDYGGDPHEVFKTKINIGNKNGNMYVVTTSSAPNLYVDPNDENSKYILGDPRTRTPMDVSSLSSVVMPLPQLGESGNHTPSNYYPTMSDARVENIIAPKIRVASSWGQTLPLTLEHAKIRCAAYQEDGYPAGRWRIPTAAELMYICKLSEHHMIPMLYGSASDDEASQYWCSTGYVDVYRPYLDDYETTKNPAGKTVYHSSGYSSTTKYSVRCVYDEWYWDNIDDDTPYTTVNGRMPAPEPGEANPYTVRIWGDKHR